LEDNHLGGCHLEPKISRRELFQRIFSLGIFWSWVSSFAATTLIVAFSLGNSDITRFRPWSPLARRKLFYRAEIKNIQMLLRRLTPLIFLIRVQVFRDPLRGELPHVQIFMNEGPNQLTLDAQIWTKSCVLLRLARQFVQ
jgi:hypothetical protein